MGWRPDNYEEFFGTILQTRYRDDMSIREVADIGADAILEALKRGAIFRNYIGQQVASEPAVLSIEVPNKKGWLIFISKETENGKAQE